jgi:Homeodomain-like domain-containing protein
MRPMVLFAETMTARRRQLDLERTTIGDKARRFVHDGRLGLVDQRTGHAGGKGHRYPETGAAYMRYVKPLYPPIHDRELVRIAQRNDGYTTHQHTVKAFLARHASPVQLERPLLAFAECTEASHARWTVVWLWAEGWNKPSIAGCLKMARSHVYALIAAFERDGIAGLEDHRAQPSPHLDTGVPVVLEQ